MSGRASGRGNVSLDDITPRVEARTGRIGLSGRYHKQKTLEADYTIDSRKTLGEGYNSAENGPVRLATGKKDGLKYAVKAFKLHNVPEPKQMELRQEVEVFLVMDHPHVARLHDAYETKDQISLVMECMEGGELFDRVTAKRKFLENDAAEAVNMMLLAVNYLHSHDVVHRDIKLENFLYEKSDTNHLKLIDFGFSKIFKEKNVKMDLSCGTLAYVAPEVLLKSYTSQCDLWSVGVVTFILLVGYMPFSGKDEEQVEAISKGNYKIKPDRWKDVSPVAFDFVKKLLEKDPAKRLTATQALEDPFIKNRRPTDGETVERADSGVVDSLRSYAQASKFRRACLSMMAWSLSMEDRSKVRGIFLEMDKSHEGTITLSELRDVLDREFHIPDNEVSAIFSALDSNHDDSIHYSDFLAAMCASRIAMHNELMLSAFRRFDADNSGKISLENLKQVLGDSFELDELRAILSEVGHATGADMSRGEIEYQEFVRYLQSPDAAPSLGEKASLIIDNHFSSDPSRSEEAGLRLKVMKSKSLEEKGLAAKTPSTPPGTRDNQGKEGPKCCVIL